MFINQNLLVISKFKVFASFAFIINLFLITIFMRSFVGIYILGFRLGELYTGFCILIAFLLLSKKLTSKYDLQETIKILPIFRLMILSFFVVLLINLPSEFNLNLIKQSSFIWSVTFIFLGIYFLSIFSHNFIVILMGIGLLSSYFITFINYPNFIMDFFIKYSDKFQFIKAADQLLILVIFNILFKKIKVSSTFKFCVFAFSSSIFLPYFISQSRGSLLATAVFIVLNSISYYKFLTGNKLKSLFVILFSVILFYVSSYLLSDINFQDFESEQNIISEVTTQIEDGILKQKDLSQGFLTFYFEEGRIKSSDNTTDWRLDIWQDLIDDLILKNKIYFGFGYEGIFEIMLDPSAPGRLGRDGLNENVHNYFFNILGRGGLFQLSIFLYLYMKIYKTWTIKNNRIDYFALIVPLMIVSSLDVTMEGVQFPFIFYTFMGYFLSDGYHN